MEINKEKNYPDLIDAPSEADDQFDHCLDLVERAIEEGEPEEGYQMEDLLAAVVVVAAKVMDQIADSDPLQARKLQARAVEALATLELRNNRRSNN